MSYFDHTLVLQLIQIIPSTLLAVLPVINPIGTGFLLNAMTRELSSSERKIIGKRIATNCMVIFFVLIFLGPYLLAFFGISLPIIRICGGALLAYMGWSMINQEEKAPPEGEPPHQNHADCTTKVFYPLTFPITAGPGVISVILALGVHHSTSLHFLNTILIELGIGLLGVSVICYFCVTTQLPTPSRPS